MEIPEKPEVHEENEILSEEQEGLDILKEKAQKYDESYGAIKQLLLDSRIEAQVLLTDARQKAAGIIREAEEQAEMLRAEARSRLNRELLQFRGSAGNIQQELENMQDCVQVILHQISEESENLCCLQRRIPQTQGVNVSRQEKMRRLYLSMQKIKKCSIQLLSVRKKRKSMWSLKSQMSMKKGYRKRCSDGGF